MRSTQVEILPLASRSVRRSYIDGTDRNCIAAHAAAAPEIGPSAPNPAFDVHQKEEKQQVLRRFGP
jgi:hypothetical protein